MNLKLFVGGFSQNTTEADIRETFRPYGQVVTVVIVKCNRTNVSKGYGFFTVDNINTYHKILDTKKFNVNGRTVEVNTAVKPNTNMPGDLLSKGFRKLFIGGLNGYTTQEDLTKYFSAFGTVINAYVIYDPVTESSRGFGYVEMQSVEAAEQILTQEIHTVGGRNVTVANHKRGFKSCLKLERRIAALQAKRIRKQPRLNNGLEEGLENSSDNNSQNSPDPSKNGENQLFNTCPVESVLNRNSLMLDIPGDTEKFWNPLPLPKLQVSNQTILPKQTGRISTMASDEDIHGSNCSSRSQFYRQLLNTSQNQQVHHTRKENIRFNHAKSDLQDRYFQKVLLKMAQPLQTAPHRR